MTAGRHRTAITLDHRIRRSRVDRLETMLTSMSRSTEMKTLLMAGTTAALLAAANLAPVMAQATKPVSQVVQWNRTLLVIVRTAGAQPATIHPTRSFAIMHAAI